MSELRIILTPNVTPKRPWVLAVLFLVALAATVEHPAQVCPFGSGGGSSSGSGGATLATIDVNGDPSDWGPVLANANQVTFDGEWANCATSTDKDYVINPGPPPACAARTISGRDLAQFAWTYDSANVYLYVKRFGSSTNTQTFYFYMDTNGNQRMNTGEKVYQVRLSGSNRRTDGTLYNYTAADTANGDPLVAPAGSTYPGYADGYTMAGSLSGGSIIYLAVTGGFADGTGFEARISWASIGVAAGTPIYFHVASTNSSNPVQVPTSIDDNLGGVDGKIGAFAFRLVSVTPDRASSAAPDAGNPTVVWYDHTITNTGTLSDRYDMTMFSSLGLRVDLYASDGATLIATDIDGNGSFSDPGDYVNPASDSNSDGRPDTPVLSGGGGAYQVKVKITAPAGVENVQDLTTLSAFSQGETSLCASARDTTAIGALTLAPAPQAKSAVAGNYADYPLVLTNNSLADVIDLRIISSLGWMVEIYADGILVAIDSNGNGVYTDAGDSIEPGFDTNGNQLPDFGTIANGGVKAFVVRLSAPAGATLGTVDNCSVLAQGATSGASATASLTATVLAALTFTPSYTTAAGTNKYSGQGQAVFYAHRLVNSLNTANAVTFSTSSDPAGWTIRIYTDPNGDGNPGDGVEITPSAPLAPLAANGGEQHLVVEVVIPSGLTLPLTHTATVTATGTGGTPAVSDEVRVSYIATYQDVNRSIAQRTFAICQTIYTKGSSLSPASAYTLRYLNPSGAPIRVLSTISDGNGEATDLYTLTSGDLTGTWTVELRNSSDALVDSLAIYVDPPTGDPSSVNPVTTGRASYNTLPGNDLSITATFNNTSAGAEYAGTTYRYLVRTPDLAEYLKSDGGFAPYTGSELTRTTSPHTVAAGASATETVTVNGITFPSAGIYRIDVTWTGSCGNTIATAALTIAVGTTLNSFGDTSHSQPLENFGSGTTVYLGGDYYLPGVAYKVAYYRPDGTFALTRAATSTSGGALSDSATVDSLITNGTWHSVVYWSTLSPPPVYNAADPLITGQDTFNVDTVAPAAPEVSSPANGSSATDVTPTITGTAEANSTVKVYVDDVLVGTVTAEPSGNWSYTLTSGQALDYGAHAVHATATDSAGNISGPSPANSFNVVFPAPVVGGPILAGAGSISGTSASEAGTAITVYMYGSSIGQTVVQADGTWVLEGVSGLTGGQIIRATAGTGAAESALSNAVVVTPAAPVINEPLAEGQTSVTGTSTAPVGSVVTVTVNGTPYAGTVLAGGTWSVPVAALAGGDQVYATVTANGQTSAQSPVGVVKYAAPVVSGPILAGAGSISGTSASEAGTAITVYMYGSSIGQTVVQADGTWVLEGVSGLTGGQIIRATAGTGAAESALSNAVVVTPAAPVINEPLAEGQTSVTGTSTAPVGSVVTVTVNGTPYAGTVLAGGTWSVPVAALAGGDQVYATVTANGQTSPADMEVVRYAPPAIDGAQVVAGARYVSGTSAAPNGTTVTVVVNVNGTPYAYATTVQDGIWLVTVPVLNSGDTVSATVGTGPPESLPASSTATVALLRNKTEVTQLAPQAATNADIFKRVAPEWPSLGVYQDVEEPVFSSGGSFTHEMSDLDPGSLPLIFYEVSGIQNDSLRVTKDAGRIVITFSP